MIYNFGFDGAGFVTHINMSVVRKAAEEEEEEGALCDEVEAKS